MLLWYLLDRLNVTDRVDMIDMIDIDMLILDLPDLPDLPDTVLLQSWHAVIMNISSTLCSIRMQ